MDNITYVLTTNGILFLLSILFWKFPPKKINNFYGYRTHKTMQNQKIWDFANSTFNKAFLKFSGLSFAAALLFAVLASGELTWQPMVFVALAILVSIMKTEKSVSESFTEEGKPKKKK